MLLYGAKFTSGLFTEVGDFIFYTIISLLVAYVTRSAYFLVTRQDSREKGWEPLFWVPFGVTWLMALWFISHDWSKFLFTCVSLLTLIVIGLLFSGGTRKMKAIWKETRDQLKQEENTLLKFS